MRARVDWFRVLVILGAGAALVALSLSLGRAFAADATVSWTHPTQRTDGTSLPLAEIRGTEIQWAKCAAGNTWPTAATPNAREVPAASTSTTITGLDYGTWCFRARTVPVTNPTTDQSAWAGPVWKQHLAPPNPPVLGVVNIVAYEVNLTGSGLAKLGRDVGRVPLGTACSEDLIVANNRATYYSVPTSAVTLYRQPRSSALVAMCSYQGG